MKKIILGMSAIALMTSMIACGNKNTENDEATEVVELVNDSTVVDTVTTPCDTLSTESVTE